MRARTTFTPSSSAAPSPAKPPSETSVAENARRDDPLPSSRVCLACGAAMFASLSAENGRRVKETGMTKHSLLAGAALAIFSFSGMAQAAATAVQSPVAAMPYDARRGVFTFAAGLEESLPAVVQVTTLGQSRGPSSENNPKPSQGGSGVIID